MPHVNEGAQAPNGLAVAAQQTAAKGHTPAPAKRQTVAPPEALRFLELLGKTPSETFFRCIGQAGTNVSRKGADLRGFDAAALEADNAAGSAVYVVVGNATGTSRPTGAIGDADCPTVPALFVEWDDRPIEWQRQAWQELGLPKPSVQVATGGKSCHLYWVLDQPLPADQWRTLQRRLLVHCDADRTLSNPSRVMRLPGFAYIDKATGKPSGRRCRLISDTGTRYSAETIEAALPPVLELPEPTPTPATAAPPPRHRHDLPPRDLEEIEQAVAYIPMRVVGQGTYETSRRALCGCAAALAEIGHADPERHALELLAGKWPDRATATQALASSTTREAATFWRIAADHGFNLSRNGNSVSVATNGHQQRQERRQEPPRQHEQGFQPRPDSQARWGMRKLGHARRMACFERCVEIQATRERNSLRRRARLLKAARDLDLHRYINRQEIAQRVLEAKDKQQGNAYRGLTAADRLAMEWPEVEWLIPDLLPANDLSILGGRPKVGKTALAMAIAAAVLKGEPVAGFPAPNTTRPVVVISDDQGDADTREALLAHGVFDHPRLIWSRRFRLTESDLDQLLADVRNNPGALVVMDSLRSVARSLQQGENDPEIGSVIYDLKAAVMDAGGSLLLVHHCNKAEGLTGVEALSGHNAISGAANTVVTLHHVENGEGKPDKEAEQRRIVREGRTGRPLDWVISRTAGGAGFHHVSTWSNWREQQQEVQAEAKRQARLTGTQRDVIEVLEGQEGAWMTCRDVVEALRLDWGEGRGTGRDAVRVRDALSRLADDGRIERVRAGREYTFRAAAGSSGLHAEHNLFQHPQHPQHDRAARDLSARGKTSASSASSASRESQVRPAADAEDAEVRPQHRNPLQRKDAEDAEDAETGYLPPRVISRPAAPPAGPIGSGSDAFDHDDDPHWPARPQQAA